MHLAPDTIAALERAGLTVRDMRYGGEHALYDGSCVMIGKFDDEGEFWNFGFDIGPDESRAIRLVARDLAAEGK